MKPILFVLALLLAVSSSWGDCVEATMSLGSCYSTDITYDFGKCNAYMSWSCEKGTITYKYSSGNNYCIPIQGSCASAGCSSSIWPGYGQVRYIRCSTQAEADSVKCALDPTAEGCGPQQDTETMDRVVQQCTSTYGTANFSYDDQGKVVGYCDSAQTSTSVTKPIAQSSSVAIKATHDSTSYYKVSCAPTCDVGQDSLLQGFFIGASHCSMEVDAETYSLSMEGCNWIDSLASVKPAVHKYRGTKGGKYVYWYSGQAVPASVTNVVKLY